MKLSARTFAALALASSAAACGEDPAPAPPPGNGAPAVATKGAPAVGTTSPAPAARPDRFDVRTDPTIEWLARGDGAEVRTGDIVDVHLVGTLPDGRIFDSTRTRDLPFAFEAGRGKVVPGLDRVMVRLRVGDRVRTLIRAPLAYGVVGIPGSVPPETDLTYEIEVLRVIPRPTWEVLASGDGPQVRPGATVSIHYETWLPDGKKVDSSREGAPFRFRAGAGDVIQGWDMIVLKMRVGDRWKASVPWFFAYGSEGAPERKVPPRQDYVFELEVVGVE